VQTNALTRRVQSLVNDAGYAGHCTIAYGPTEAVVTFEGTSKTVTTPFIIAAGQELGLLAVTVSAGVLAQLEA